MAAVEHQGVRGDGHGHPVGLSGLWDHVCDRLNYFTITEPVCYTTDAIGRRRRVYDNSQTPTRCCGS